MSDGWFHERCGERLMLKPRKKEWRTIWWCPSCDLQVTFGKVNATPHLLAAYAIGGAAAVRAIWDAEP